MKLKPHKIQIDDLDWVEFYPVIWRPQTYDEKIAALVGYMTGDGTVAARKSNPKKFQSAFYSNSMEDLVKILQDCLETGISRSETVNKKKTRDGYDQSYQLQLSDFGTSILVDLGVPVGSKTSQNFDVPDWIKNGTNGVKRAYLAALFGAEGTMPAHDRSSKARTPRNPTLNMCKKIGYCADDFFDSLKSMVRDIGIDCETSVTCGADGYKTYWLRIGKSVENAIKFFDDLGFVYCDDKSVLGWKWSKYLKAYKYAAENRAKTVLSKDRDTTYSKLGAQLGISKGAAFRLRKDVLSGKKPTAGHGFPHFKEWIGCRWIESLGVMRIRIDNKKHRNEPLSVWNVRVSSHDHSYLLASGANNFNSFETASGRIYEDYSKDNYTDEVIKPHEQLHWMHDQNYTPLSSAVGVIRDNSLYLLDEIVLISAVSRQSAEEFVEKFKSHKNKTVCLYGDPAGRAGEKHGHASDYTDIKEVLTSNGWRVVDKVKKAHPGIKDRQNQLRARIKNAAGEVRLYINPRTAEWCHKGISTVQLQKGSTFQEDQTNKYQHITTAIGYMVDVVWPINRAVISTSKLRG